MLLKNKLDNIKTLLEADNVLATVEERYCYAKDASNLKKAFKIPDIVVFVKSIEDVQKVVKYANLHSIPIISRGAGTNMVGACVCEQGGIVLNFSKMNKIIDINSTNMTATVQPGVILGDLKNKVEEIGLFYPPDPSNYKVSTIGGSIAQSSGGAMSFKYGTTKDYVLSLKVVTADGELIQLGAETTKDAMGYHLNQLIIGSEGTLAIVVEATLKLIPKPEARRIIISYFNNEEDAISAVEKITSELISPASIDFMDKNSMITVEDFTQCGFRTENKCVLLIDLDGFAISMDEQIIKVQNALKFANATEIIVPKDEEESKKYWNARRSSYAASTRLAPDVISEDIIVPRDKLVYLIQKCEEISLEFNLKMCLVGHIGDGNLHPQFVLNLEKEDDYRNYLSAKSILYQFVNMFNYNDLEAYDEMMQQ
jgi:glycolate oxidase